jgi:hypothetical protein
MPLKLAEPHEATRWARQRLEEASKDAYGRLEVGGRYHPDLCVRPQTISRALLILDTVVKALVQRGLEVTVASNHPNSDSRLFIQSGHERLVLQVEERLTQQPHVATVSGRRDPRSAGEERQTAPMALHRSPAGAGPDLGVQARKPDRPN